MVSTSSVGRAQSGALAGSVPASAGCGPGYHWYCRGNPADSAAKPTPGLLLAGGGTDQDDAFKWLVDHSGGGDVVVLRAHGDDEYNPYIDELGKVDSVETLVIDDPRGARDPFVVERVRNAEAVFIAGGDQWDYIRMWKDTPLGAALQADLDCGVPMGGTSAGLAVLGQHVFSAVHDTIDSPQALADIHDPRITLEDHFLAAPNLAHVLTDTHFGARDRMGRLLAFLARVREGGDLVAKGIAVDEATAVLVEGDGSARVTGEGNAYFLSAANANVTSTAPLGMQGVEVDRVAAGARFDLKAWTGNSRHYTLDVDHGIIASAPPGPVY